MKKPKKDTRLTVRIRSGLKEQVQEYSEKSDRSLAWIVEEALTEYLKSRHKPGTTHS